MPSSYTPCAVACAQWQIEVRDVHPGVNAGRRARPGPRYPLSLLATGERCRFLRSSAIVEVQHLSRFPWTVGQSIPLNHQYNPKQPKTNTQKNRRTESLTKDLNHTTNQIDQQPGPKTSKSNNNNPKKHHKRQITPKKLQPT